MEDGEWGGTLDTEAGTLGRRPAAGRHVRRLSNTIFCHVVIVVVLHHVVVRQSSLSSAYVKSSLVIGVVLRHSGCH